MITADSIFRMFIGRKLHCHHAFVITATLKICSVFMIFILFMSLGCHSMKRHMR